MTRLAWGSPGERYYETGVDRGVFYPNEDTGIVWNGLISVSESDGGVEVRSYYQDGVKIQERATSKEFDAVLTAFSSPAEFDEFDGTLEVYTGLYATGQRRKSFGLSYRTLIGNDIDGSDHAYKIHIIHNVLAVPSDHENSSISTEENPIEFSWKLSATPTIGLGYRPTAHFIVDTRHAGAETVERLEDILYGSDTTAARIPSAGEILDLFAEYAVFKLTVVSDDLYVVEGSTVTEVAPGHFAAEHADITDNGDGTFEIL